MSIELKIDDTTLKQLNSLVARKRISKQEYIISLIKRSLKLEELDNIRNELKGVAKKKGFKAESDIFRAIS